VKTGLLGQAIQMMMRTSLPMVLPPVV